MTVPANARILQAITKPIVEAAKPAAKSEIEWTPIEPTSLAPHLRQQYDAIMAAQKALTALKATFTDDLTKAIDPLDGEKVLVGWPRKPWATGISLAIVKDEPKPAKRNAAVSLADYLAKKA